MLKEHDDEKKDVENHLVAERAHVGGHNMDGKHLTVTDHVRAWKVVTIFAVRS